VPQAEGDRSFHAYVHIPFCEVRCGYCDFNTYLQSEIGGVKQATFETSLVQEVDFSASVLRDSGFNLAKLSSVFFGGGTPSLFAAAQIGTVLDSLRERFGLSSEAEITLEANPESLSLEKLEELAGFGVNRISFGSQSFDPSVLAVLDRRHDPSKLQPLITAANKIGLRTSMDLIYGAPGESMQSWQETVEQAIDQGTEHISAYSLIVEPGTKMNRQISSGELPDVDEDLNADKYEWMTEAFESAGLDWYEISNFGVPSVHNLAYWSSQDWWGYGPGAHSHIAGNRFWNRKHPAAYQAALNAGSPAAGIERLTDRQRLEEELMLGLRTKFGVRKQLFTDLGTPPAEVARQIGLGNLKPDGNRIVLTKEGRLLADGLAVNFLN